MNWSKYAPYFSEDEFKCKHTGKCFMDEKFMDTLLTIRKEYGKPMNISSGYRDKTHPVEASKKGTGEHQFGTCCDVAISGNGATELLRIAMKHGVTRIGVQQKGVFKSRFLHLGVGSQGKFPNPWIWSY
jgi:hypothetical protein